VLTILPGADGVEFGIGQFDRRYHSVLSQITTPTKRVLLKMSERFRRTGQNSSIRVRR
jgi:hypothetical protein